MQQETRRKPAKNEPFGKNGTRLRRGTAGATGPRIRNRPGSAHATSPLIDLNYATAVAPDSATAWSSSTVLPETPMAPITVPA